MGWTFTHRPKGMKALEFFKQEFEHPEGHSTVLDVASPNFAETYVLVEANPHDRDPYRIAIACMTRWRRDDYYNFGYKDMDETMGPNIANCPERIMKRLSPISDFSDPDSGQGAAKWRKRCWEKIEARNAIAKAVKDGGGTYVRLEKPVRFSDGWRKDKFYIASLRPHRVYSTRRDAEVPRHQFGVSLQLLIQYGAKPISIAEAEGDFSELEVA